MLVTENGFGRQWSSHREDGSSRLSFSEVGDETLALYRVLPSTTGGVYWKSVPMRDVREWLAARLVKSGIVF
jgi:hypothetical protein